MTMQSERFSALVDAYGADLRRWPVSERAQGQSFAAADEAARALVDHAAALDALLAQARGLEPSEALTRRVLAEAPRPRAAGRFSLMGWASGAGWAAAAAAGLLVGVSLGERAMVAWQADAAIDQASAGSLDETEYLG